MTSLDGELILTPGLSSQGRKPRSHGCFSALVAAAGLALGCSSGGGAHFGSTGNGGSVGGGGSSVGIGGQGGQSGPGSGGSSVSASGGTGAGGQTLAGTGGDIMTGGQTTLGSGGRATGGQNTAGSGGSATGGQTTPGSGGSTTGGQAGKATGGAATGGQSGVGTGGVSASGGSTPTSSRDAGATGGATSDAATGGAGGTGSTGTLIVNDRFWKDTAGTPIYSQGGGVMQVGNTYYWYGVKYTGAVTFAAAPSGKNSDSSFAGVTIYSSNDLANWKLENTVTFSNAGSWFGRLGVVYNATSKKYVLVAQGAGGLFFATSDTPTGNFTFDNVQTNLPGIVNGATGDQTTFQDDDGSAYLVSSSSNGRANRYVSPLRPADFLAAENAILVYSGGGREGNCMFKYNGTYVFCSSDLHGWNASQSYCVSATSLKGPWSAEFVLDGTGSDFSHVTQTGFFIAVKGTAQTTIIFAGDRWSDFAGNGLGYNQWMPLTFTGTTPHFQSLSQWSIDAATGTWSVAPGNNYVLNPTFEADRVAVTQPAGWTTSNGSNVSGGHTGNWSWQLAGTASLDQLITLPNGTYSLSAWIKASAAGGQLYAKGFGGTEKTAAIAASTAWTNVTITGIAVSNGACDVGITTSGQTVTVDDFVLSQN
jgi:hypothetical protein